MSYQIPQQLQYKEKIMFDLTFRQLAYAFLFGFLNIIAFKMSPSIYFAIPFIFSFSFLAVLFMFFNLDQLIKNYKDFLWNREIIEDTKKMSGFFEFGQVEKNTILTKNKKKVAVLKVSPINFGIKPDDEKESIIYAFQKFLNSLDFPIQILMNTESINIDSYVKSIEETTDDEKFKELFEKYKNHLRKTIVSDKLLNRIFYVIIPEKTDIKIQVDICTDRLRTMNMKVYPLREKGLAKFVNSMQFKFIKNNQDHIETDRGFSRIIYASGYPRNVELGFLDKIVSSLSDFNLSIHINPKPIDETMVGLNK